ncbi:MAG: IS1182 family transposase [Gammaproteobacteria bacterium]|nr:IS1182 family transposase [Gammaproteobacteria bacterium]
MPERRYREVQSRSQFALFPPSMDDYVSGDNPVRAIDAFVGTLDLESLGFGHAEAYGGAGQPAYDPGLLLKLYLYGYQHGVRSSRRLEAETRRNLEVIWLCRGAAPSYKTIADFRKDNAPALRSANREFVLLCRELSLLGGGRVAVDGTFMKADASLDGIHTGAGLEKDLKRLDERIAAYHRRLDEADAAPEDGDAEPELAAKMKALLEKREHREALRERLLESGAGQVSEVDPDARLLNKGGGTVGGYNCQIAVDGKHKLIVAEDVVQDGNDARRLEPMLTRAAAAVGNGKLTGLADTGYCAGEQLKACEDKGMDVYAPLPERAARKGVDGRFGSDDFQYEAEDDAHICPAGRLLTRSGSSSVMGGRRYFAYVPVAGACRDCPLSARCLPPKSATRKVFRWEHADVVDRHREKMGGAAAAKLMRERAALVEHPFGAIKRWAGIDHFLMRGLDKCRGEFGLMTLGYNFKRVVNELGADALAAHCLRKRGATAALA